MPDKTNQLNRVLVPVRYAAWLSGDLGKQLLTTLSSSVEPHLDAKVTKLPRGFLVESEERPGFMVDVLADAMKEVETATEATYPVFHAEMGPVWTGTLQVVY